MERKNCLTLDVLIPLYNEKERYVILADCYLNDREKAKDIVSDSFAYLLEHKDTLPDHPAQIKSYLLQVVKHKCLNEIKREGIKQNTYRNMYEIDVSVLSDDNVTRHIAESDVREIFSIAGGRMKDLTFQIYTSSRFGGLSHKELAKLYGITVNRIAKEISKENKIMGLIVKHYLPAILSGILAFRLRDGAGFFMNLIQNLF